MTPFEKLLIAHLVGDWILAQTHWEAMNKAKNWFACISHAFKWTLAILFGLMWVIGSADIPTKAMGALLLMGVLHAIIDRRWPVLWLFRLKEYLPFGDPWVGGPSPLKLDPPMWLIICLDQVLHIVQVAIIASVIS